MSRVSIVVDVFVIEDDDDDDDVDRASEDLSLIADLACA